MNKTKQFKRTALPKSAKSMVSLMLLLIAVFMPQGAWATDFISEIKVSVEKDDKNKGSNARKHLTDDGYTIVKDADGNIADLNAGGGGYYVYIGYKTTTILADAITDLLIVESSSDPKFDAHAIDNITNANVTYKGKKYYRCANYKYNDERLDCDLNRGRTGTPDIVLFYTTDGNTDKGGTLLTSISVVDNTTTTGVSYTRHWKYGTDEEKTKDEEILADTYGNINEGCKSPHYITYTTHGHTFTNADFDATHHKVLCENCGFVPEYIAHEWEDSGEEYTPATCVKLAVHYQTCKYCKRTGDTNHVFDYGSYGPHNYTLTGSLKDEAKCYAWPVYYKKCGICGYEGDASQTVLGNTKPDHTYDSDGFCTVCQSGTKPPKEGNYYILSLPCHLVWFRDATNGAKAWTYMPYANAKLANTIDMNGIKWDSSIGDVGGGFRGTFEGQRYAIKNLNTGLTYSYGSGCACLFNTIDDGGFVQNLVVENYRPFQLVTNTGLVRTNKGLILGVEMNNCYLQYHAGYDNRGGLCGVNEDKIERCIVMNTTLRNRRGGAYSSVGALCGVNKEGAIINSCYLYDITYQDMTNYHALADPTKTNQGSISCCFYNNDNSSGASLGNLSDCMQRDKGAFACGEVAWRLEGCKSFDDFTKYWYQVLGLDAVPHLTPDAYPVKKTHVVNCTTWQPLYVIYANPSTPYFDHAFETENIRPYRNQAGYDRRRCTRCGLVEVLKEYNKCGDFDSDGEFTVADLIHIVQGVNNSETSLEYDINYDNKVDKQDIELGAGLLLGTKTLKIELDTRPRDLMAEYPYDFNDSYYVTTTGSIKFYPEETGKYGFDIKVVRIHEKKYKEPIIEKTGPCSFKITLTPNCGGTYTIRVTSKDGSGTFCDFDWSCVVI